MRVAVIITSSQREPFLALLFFTGPTGLVLGGSSMLHLAGEGAKNRYVNVIISYNHMLLQLL